jgi:hypothetical protein
MATLKLTVHATIAVDGEEHEIGSLTTPEQVTIGTAGSEILIDQIHEVAASGGTKEIFDVADDLADFEFLIIISTQDVLLQIVVSDSGSPTEQFLVLTLKADVPFILGADEAQAGSVTVDNFNGTADTVDRINVKNNAASAAKVRVLAVS